MAEHFKYALSSAESAPVAAPILLTGDIFKRITAASKLGYAALEIHLREDDLMDSGKVKAALETAGICFSALVTGRLCTQGQVNLIDDRPYITEAAMKGMRGYISLAAEYGTNLIVGWIRGKIPEGTERRPYLVRLARNLKMLCEEAAEHGVKFFVEVINRYEINVFTTAQETIDFLNIWEIPNCYVHLDTFHMNIDETDPCTAIRACGGRLGYFHAADNTRMYPGSGTLDFRSYLSTLKEIGYRGYISVECLPRPDGETAARKALAYLRKCE